MEIHETDLVTPIVTKYGLKAYEGVYNLCEIAHGEGITNSLHFAYDCQGAYGFTDSELCAIFKFYLWMNNVQEGTECQA